MKKFIKYKTGKRIGHGQHYHIARNYGMGKYVLSNVGRTHFLNQPISYTVSAYPFIGLSDHLEHNDKIQHKSTVASDKLTYRMSDQELKALGKDFSVKNLTKYGKDREGIEKAEEEILKKRYGKNAVRKISLNAFYPQREPWADEHMNFILKTKRQESDNLFSEASKHKNQQEERLNYYGEPIYYRRRPYSEIYDVPVYRYNKQLREVKLREIEDTYGSVAKKKEAEAWKLLHEAEEREAELVDKK